LISGRVFSNCDEWSSILDGSDIFVIDCVFKDAITLTVTAQKCAEEKEGSEKEDTLDRKWIIAIIVGGVLIVPAIILLAVIATSKKKRRDIPRTALMMRTFKGQDRRTHRATVSVTAFDATC
jgi:hypothetical protein